MPGAIHLNDGEHPKALARQFIASFRTLLLSEAATGLDPALLEIVRRYFLGVAASTLAQPDSAVCLTLTPRCPVQGGQLAKHLAAKISPLYCRSG
jgi:hypothetical protein